MPYKQLSGGTHSYKHIHQENRKTSNKPPNLKLQGTVKEQQTKLKFSRRKDLIKIRAEINELRDRKRVEKINQTKVTFLKR